MTGLSRRAFLASTTALAGAWLLPFDQLGRALAAPLRPSDAPTTLLQTIRSAAPTRNKWRPLKAAAGEPYLPRLDILGKAPAAGRAQKRRSLLYAGHFTDMHIIDAQSPGRLEPLFAMSAMFVDALRSQETMTVQVLAAMVRAVRASATSPLTGAPMTVVLNTGDSADSMSSLELRWCIDMLDGVTVTPNSGGPDYEGVQAWPNSYAYHPDSPEINEYGDYGFPKIPGLLKEAVSKPVESPGVPVPWYVVYGNHDTLFMGNMDPGSDLRTFAIGDRKAASWPAVAGNLVGSMSAERSVWSRLNEYLDTQFGLNPGVGMKAVTPDRKRTLFDQREFMEEHLDSPANPGPVGHGFTRESIDKGETWWRTDPTPYFTVLGLDTCNQVAGADGAVPQNQLDWLKTQLADAQAQNRLVAVISHHNSLTLDNPAEPTIGAGQRLIHSEEFVQTLHQYPNLIAWINGHTHINTIQAHPRGNGAGFWEITAASCIDFPQQQQLIEVIDNRDGTLSIFATTIDHLSDPEWSTGNFSPTALPSLSRELASNSWSLDPAAHLGSKLDRNTELLLKAPFDMTKISDKAVATATASAKARLIANKAVAL